MVPLALGTQTVGSVLRPAAYCGIVGLKGTHGRVSAAGVIPLAPSLDHVGVLARCVTDAALALGIMAGHDAADEFSSHEPVPSMTPPVRPRAPRIGLVRDFWEELATPEVRAQVEGVAERCAAAGATVTQVRLQFSVGDVRAASNAILQFEAARYHRLNFMKHRDAYAPGIGRLITAGLESDEGGYEAALKAKAGLREALESVFSGCDVLMLPVAPSTAPKGLESTGDSVFCAPASTTGLPSISLPSGVGEGGLPLGVQLVGPAFGEPGLIAAAAWLEALLAFDARPAI
jgi:amidase